MSTFVSSFHICLAFAWVSMAPSSSVLLRTTSSATSCSVIETLRCPPVRPYSCCLTLSILSAPSHFTSRRLRPYVTDANHYWRLSVYAPLINTPLRLYALTALLWTAHTSTLRHPTASPTALATTLTTHDTARYATSNRIAFYPIQQNVCWRPQLGYHRR